MSLRRFPKHAAGGGEGALRFKKDRENMTDGGQKKVNTHAGLVCTPAKLHVGRGIQRPGMISFVSLERPLRALSIPSSLVPLGISASKLRYVLLPNWLEGRGQRRVQNPHVASRTEAPKRTTHRLIATPHGVVSVEIVVSVEPFFCNSKRGKNVVHKFRAPAYKLPRAREP